MAGLTDHHDVVVIGAGLSGINAGYRLQTMCPDQDYVILESRADIGGTWDLFRYPGVRSDSDMYTLGFPFEPWTGDKSIADGADILGYLRSTAAKYGIDRHIVTGTTVTDAAWSSGDARWTLRCETADGTREVTARFVYFCSGYYRYDAGYTPDFPGRADFTGQIIHPQAWPEGVQVDGRRFVVIGSGATAMTLVPALARRGADVTMLQRSPTYVISLAPVDALAHWLRRHLPAQRAYQVTRWKNAVTTQVFYQFCRRAPRAAAGMLRRGVMAQLRGAGVDERHFTPRYDPWDQRLCVVPDGDLFAALRRHDVQLVTDTVERFTRTGVRTTGGQELPADVIVTATGLTMQVAGGVRISVDGEPVDLARRFIYRGLMIEGVPNAAMCIGYTNASWTLRSDLSTRIFCRFIAHVARRGADFGYPTPARRMRRSDAIDLASGYVRRGIAAFPHQGDRRPWYLRQNYLLDRWDTYRADLDDQITYRRAHAAAAAAADRPGRVA